MEIRRPGKVRPQLLQGTGRSRDPYKTDPREAGNRMNNTTFSEAAFRSGAGCGKPACTQSPVYLRMVRFRFLLVELACGM